jgi:hypothetical protein
VAETFDEELEIRGLLDFGKEFIRTFDLSWYDGLIDDKIKIQRMIFPNGVKYLNGVFSNKRLAYSFDLINAFAPPHVSSGDPARIRTEDQELKRLLLYR